MKFPLSWLKSHLETEARVEDIARALTDLGLEVEEVIDRAGGLAPFVVGHVVEASKHPDADRLTVCIVDTGADRVQVVCGAPNARTGMKGVFAAAGVKIPGTGLDLKKSVIRGVESAGMLCSAREVGIGEDHEGIIELPDDAEIGAPAASVLGLGDPLFDIAITPNRGDCLGIHGVARDLAAAGVGKLIPLSPEAIEGSFENPTGVSFDFTAGAADACTLFAGRTIRGLKNGPSPDWLQRWLLSVGLRPISALVDITNFLTLDRARPLHVFDADKIAGDLTVRLARQGETLMALDGKAYELDPSMTVISDEGGVLSLGGVIGGEATGCTDESVNVFVEAAFFDPVRTAATGRKLNIESDARFRFERGVDPASTLPGIEAATGLIMELCGGEASEVTVTGAVPEVTKAIRFEPSRVMGLGGVDVAQDESRRILEALGFGTEEVNGAIAVRVPTWRPDIEGEADLVEEVLRVYGYDRIPAVPFAKDGVLSKPVEAPTSRRRRHAARALAANGMVEVVTYSFLAEAQARLFGGGDPALRLVNPISAELTDMRPSLLANLIVACGRNAARGSPDLALFEVGPAFADDTPDGQQAVAAGVRAGASGPRHWLAPGRAVDVFDAKADALVALGAAGAPGQSLQITPGAPAWYHPGRSGAMRLGPKMVLAHFGEIHPRVLRALDVKGPICGFEVFLDLLPAPRKRASKARPALKPSPFQAVERDFAFVIDADVGAAALVRAAQSADKKLIAGVSVFDQYVGKELGDAKKSIAISVRLEPTEATLTETEIDAVSAKVIDAVNKATGGVLRS